MFLPLPALPHEVVGPGEESEEEGGGGDCRREERVVDGREGGGPEGAVLGRHEGSRQHPQAERAVGYLLSNLDVSSVSGVFLPLPALPHEVVSPVVCSSVSLLFTMKMDNCSTGLPR